ncbi:hypothetical protein DFH08DRAFT_1084304 [Mycena albidolilacea]|uniref:Uncharacterized protein n=1 Tax=Mycena albidolilacea TaxID=1033008 RepID=A0AAD6ZLT3_9AGAR|nr:hypothetical protein DFH08DRAFT_1084304 [Mycena albidolilacea]
MMFSPFGMVTARSTEPVKKYTLDEQRALAAKTVHKVRAFLLGASRFEARYADYPNDRISIESGGVVLAAAQLEAGVRYNVFWDYQGESGSDIAWKFRGDDGLASSICDMEDSMADDPNIGMPGNLLQMAASDWAQTFYDTIANYEMYGSVVKPSEPHPEPDPDHPPNHANPEHEDYDPDYEIEYPDYPTLVAAKWNSIFERVKTDEHDVECMFKHTRQGCLEPAGACPFKHTPSSSHSFADGGRRMPAMDVMDPYMYYKFWDSD